MKKILIFSPGCYTPAVSIIYELDTMLSLIERKGGKQSWLNDIQYKCNYFRKKSIERELKIPKYPLSNMITPLIFDDIDANKIFLYLKNNFNIYVNPCSGILSKKMIRISHIGNNELKDFDNLLDKIDITINNIKNGNTI